MLLCCLVTATGWLAPRSLAASADVEQALARLKSAYAEAWSVSREISIEAVKFETVRLVGPEPAGMLATKRHGLAPAALQGPSRPMLDVRGWMSGNGQRRLEMSSANVLSGPEVLRWEVRGIGTEFSFNSMKLKSSLVSLGTRTDQFAWEESDLLPEDDTLFPGYLAQQMHAYLTSLPPGEVRVTRDATSVQIILDRRRLVLDIDAKNGAIRGARMAFVANPTQDVVVEYEGVLSDRIYPAPHPAAMYRSRVPAGSPGARDQIAIRYDVVAASAANPARFHWSSIADRGLRLDNKTIIRPDGSVDAKATERHAQRRAPIVPAPEELFPVPKAGWSGWRLAVVAAGGACVVIGLIWLFARTRGK